MLWVLSLLGSALNHFQTLSQKYRFCRCFCATSQCIHCIMGIPVLTQSSTGSTTNTLHFYPVHHLSTTIHCNAIHNAMI
ncbi:uncharacterized protein C8R40DRAFT_1137828 [Lentinula edodes]|uniref:uncharacterized protein n=1 Tax=Lentinula edodes TaxID=5353 RepID=UPI001E8EE83F|nr:uncharacterized protein C8R40DRAFT_1137828 [Lentinula edodes]KAH7867615.1 hypothetical protein C8R40DRAFT_1137828 [Lentinula edodes]